MREQRGVYFVPDDDPDCEDIMNNARRNIGNKEGLRDAVRSHETSQPERFKLEAT